MADQAFSRGPSIKFDYGEYWVRDLHFHVPVSDPEFWQSESVYEKLVQTLGFLTDDRYHFHFYKRKKSKPTSGFLFDKEVVNDSYDEVIMFSGGLDSLAGAIQEVLVSQRPVVLVSHCSNPKTVSYQRELAEKLQQRALRNKKPLHLAVSINKQKHLSRESTQRSRSFLFNAIGITVASAFNRSKLRFYENGVTSMNLPLSHQVIAGRASRTTHPKVFHGLAQLASIILNKDFVIENPFLWKTKAEVIQSIHSAGQGDLIRIARSCAHTREHSNQYPHCGRCSQCVDRHLSMLATGLEASLDPPSGYRVDVIREPRLDADRILIEGYINSARNIQRMAGVNEFIQYYPQVLDAARYTGWSASQAVREIFDLLTRHSHGVVRALERAFTQNAREFAQGNVQEGSLLALALTASIQHPSDWGRIVSNPSPLPEDSNPVRSDVSLRSPLRLAEDQLGFSYRGRLLEFGNNNPFRFLICLNDHFNRFMSYSVISNFVWGNDFQSGINLHRLAYQVRKKFESEKVNDLKIDGSQTERYRLGPNEDMAV